MFFGLLCTYAVAYGVLSFMNGVVTWAFSPPVIAPVTAYVTEKLDEFRIEDLGHLHGEGIFASRPVVLASEFPILQTYSEDLQKEELFRVYNLTNFEIADIKSMFIPLLTFEQWSAALPAPVRDLQRRDLLVPVLDYLKRVPTLRQEGKKNA